MDLCDAFAILKMADSQKTPSAYVGTGAVIGAAATSAAVPVVQAVGFTATGITSGSAAASMMSSSAVAGGGGISGGSAVAVLQSIGSTGAVPLGIAAATIAAPVAIALGVHGAATGLHKDKCDSISAYEARDRNEMYWVLAIEKGPGNVRVLRFDKESDARHRFSKSWSIRVLYNPEGKEVAAGGWNRWAHATIRRVMKGEYFAD